MSNREFTATRTMLANAFATAGAELLEYMGTSAALAAIPSTEPARYVVAGTLAEIVKLLPAAEVIRPAAAEKPTGDLTDERHPLVDLLKRAIGALAIHDEPEARAIGLEARELITDKFAARQSRQAERRIPDDVRRALDRMCTPLDESRLSGATAQEDARCMQIIKQFIEGTSPASQEGAHAAPEVRNAILDEAIAVVPGGSICDPQHVVDAIRSIKTPASAERSGDHG